MSAEVPCTTGECFFGSHMQPVTRLLSSSHFQSLNSLSVQSSRLDRIVIPHRFSIL